MAVVVLAVQQLETHVLQPFLMGRAVALHPLVVIAAVATGSFLLGAVGALFAVPILALANSEMRSYAAQSTSGPPRFGDIEASAPATGAEGPGRRAHEPSGSDAGRTGPAALAASAAARMHSDASSRTAVQRRKPWTIPFATRTSTGTPASCSRRA